MSYFKCAICGMYKDDGNPEINVCAMCILLLNNERYLHLFT